MKQAIKYSLIIVVALLVIYLSLDIQNLEKYRATLQPKTFNVEQYALNFYNDSLPHCIENAVQLDYLMQKLNSDPEDAFEKYGHKLGISKTWYFMVKGLGTIKSIEPDFVVVNIGSMQTIKIATDFIFGNAVRDGSGKVNINDFVNMTDFNNVSVAINKMVKEKVVSGLRNSAEVGQTIEFAGAMEISEENTDLSSVLIIPVSVKLSNGETN